MPRYHSSSASSSNSSRSSRSYGSTKTSRTDATAYSSISAHSKQPRSHTSTTQSSRPLQIPQQTSLRSSGDTYASTVDVEEKSQPTERAPKIAARDRYQCYAPDAIPATPKAFATLFPTTRRLMIQHDDSTIDGNMNLRVDIEISTAEHEPKKFTLFHLRMKDLQEREFSLRRYCRDSGREVASSKKRYFRSTTSTPCTATSRSKDSLSSSLRQFSFRPKPCQRQDPGYASADDDDDDDDDRYMKETLNLLTAPAEQVVTCPTNGIRLDFSNYAQVTVNLNKTGGLVEYDFEYWGDSYLWRREKHFDDGETVCSYHLINQSTGQKVAIVMPDILSAQKSKWESKEGGWVPASSMRILRSDISDDLGDVIVATGLTALTDDSMRLHFRGLTSR